MHALKSTALKRNFIYIFWISIEKTCNKLKFQHFGIYGMPNMFSRRFFISFFLSFFPHVFSWLCFFVKFELNSKIKVWNKQANLHSQDLMHNFEYSKLILSTLNFFGDLSDVFYLWDRIWKHQASENEVGK